jgi:hypothetical protein
MNLLVRSPAKLLQIFGGLLALQTIVWEMVRMKADFRFIVEPWSLIGHELTEGWVIFAMAAGLLILSLVSWIVVPPERAQLQAVVLALIVWLAAILITIVADPRTQELSVAPVGAILGSWGAAFFLVRMVFNVGQRWVPWMKRSRYSFASWFVLGGIFYFGYVRPVMVDEVYMVEVWVIVAIFFGAPLAIAAVAAPVDLAPNRILILSTLAAMIVSALMAGPMRSTLVRLQEEQSGIAAPYKDTQITWGWILSVAGFTLMWFGAIGDWARRRDQLISRQRAEQQRAAAEENLRELEESSR